MRTVKFDLRDGLTIGEATEKAMVLREATAADLIEATEESEKLVTVGGEPTLVASPTLVGMNTLRRQVVTVGNHKGPLLLSELKKFSSVDLGLTQEKALELEQAALKEFSGRGRLDAGAEGAD